MPRYVSVDTPLVCTDEWRAYQGLGALGYRHRTVIHDRNFVAPRGEHVDGRVVRVHT